MTTKVNEIASRIYRLSTLAPEIGPNGFTFNQFLLDDDEPLLFHTGHRSMFPTVREAIESFLSLDRLRWIAFGHVESDECGAMNETPRRRSEQPGPARRARLHGLVERDGPTATPTDGQRRDDAAGRHADPPPRHSARSPRLGGASPLRGNDRDPAVRRPVHPPRRRARSDRSRHRRPSRPKTCSAIRALRPARRGPLHALLTSNHEPLPSCTARRSPATVRPLCAPSPRCTPGRLTTTP